MSKSFLVLFFKKEPLSCYQGILRVAAALLRARRAAF